VKTTQLLAFGVLSCSLPAKEHCQAWIPNGNRGLGRRFHSKPNANFRHPSNQERMQDLTPVPSENKTPNSENNLKLPDIERLFNQQIFGLHDEKSAKLDKLTLKSIWHKPYHPKDPMTLFRLGLLIRHAYRALSLNGKHDSLDVQLQHKLHQHGYQLTQLKLDNNTWAVTMHRKNEVIVNFRGSGSWQELIDNIRFWPTKNESIPVEERTHHRISELFEKLWPELERQLLDISKSQNQTLDISFSGHSLGGSLAKLSALRISNQLFNNSSALDANIKLVCTYGTPKTLFDLSRKAYCKLGLDNITIAITNHQDIVPILPPDWFASYEAVGEQLHITREGKIWYKPDPERVRQERSRDYEGNFSVNEMNLEQLKITDIRWIRDHHLDNYLLALSNHTNSSLVEHNNSEYNRTDHSS